MLVLFDLVNIKQGTYRYVVTPRSIQEKALVGAGGKKGRSGHWKTPCKLENQTQQEVNSPPFFYPHVFLFEMAESSVSNLHIFQQTGHLFRSRLECQEILFALLKKASQLGL